MKASEIIAILQSQIKEKGDVEVYLHGAYGACEKTFEPLSPEYFSKSKRNWTRPEFDPKYVHIWTDICTG